MGAHVGWVHVFLDLPAELEESGRSFWSRVTGWPPGPAWPEHPEFRSLQPAEGSAYVHVQRIDGPPRVHVDLAVQDIDDAAKHLVALGAGAVERRRHWQQMTSPGGLPFCLVTADPTALRPVPVSWPGGHRSRVTQLCIDVPPRRHDTEWAFWQAATGWEHETSRFDEFRSLRAPAGCPVRVLLQRLGSDDTANPVRAHIDLGSDDVAAEVARARALGAVLVDDGHPWTVLRDNSGLEFCVTPRSPG